MPANAMSRVVASMASCTAIAMPGVGSSRVEGLAWCARRRQSRSHFLGAVFFGFSTASRPFVSSRFTTAARFTSRPVSSESRSA